MLSVFFFSVVLPLSLQVESIIRQRDMYKVLLAQQTASATGQNISFDLPTSTTPTRGTATAAAAAVAAVAGSVVAGAEGADASRIIKEMQVRDWLLFFLFLVFVV